MTENRRIKKINQKQNKKRRRNKNKENVFIFAQENDGQLNRQNE